MLQKQALSAIPNLIDGKTFLHLHNFTDLGVQELNVLGR